MNVKKNHKIAATITTLIAVSSCSKPNFPQDEWFRPWRIGAAIPYGYASNVIEAYGVNTTEEWISLMLPYGNLGSSTRLNLHNMRDNLNDDTYDGYGLPLHPFTNFAPSQIGLGTNVLPDQIYMIWNSLYDDTEYTTVIDITPQIKTAMTKPYPHLWLEGQNCYQTTFIMGLLPNGRAKLWLDGCRFYTYIGQFEPRKAKPYNSEPSDKNENPAYIVARKEGLTIDPIPWEKVEQVWHNRKQDTIQTLEEALKRPAYSAKTK